MVAREEQGIMGKLISKQMCKRWNVKFALGGISFKQGLVDCATEDRAEWIKSVGPELLSCKGQNRWHVLEMKYQGHTYSILWEIVGIMKADGNMVDSKTVNLMSIEEKRMDDLHLDILRLKTQNIS